MKDVNRAANKFRKYADHGLNEHEILRGFFIIEVTEVQLYYHQRSTLQMGKILQTPVYPANYNTLNRFWKSKI